MSDPNKLTRIIDAETVEMSDRDRALVRKGAALTLWYVMEEWHAMGLALKNATPDLIACSPTVRR